MINKIALVMPKFSEGFSLDSVPLGLAYIGAVLKNYDYAVDGYNLQHDIVKDYSKYQLIGISTTSAMIDDAIQVAKNIKMRSTAIVVLGGAHVSAVRMYLLSRKKFCNMRKLIMQFMVRVKFRF